MEKKLTIAIPAYNISKYIDNIINSIISVKNKMLLEVIIVNDGSKDDTIEKANNYKNKYPEIIRVIDKENGGHGSTINAAIKEAKGKYFKVIDGDDWVDSSQLDLLLEHLDKIEDDMLVCSYTQVMDDGEIIKKIKDIPKGLEYDTTYQMGEVCSMVDSPYEFHRVYYKTEIYKKSKELDENCFYVDIEYIFFPLKNVKSVRFLNYNIYMYRLGRDGQSVSLDSYIKNKSNLGTVLNGLCEFVHEEKLKDNIREYIIKRIDTFVATIATVYLLMNDKKEANNFYKKIIEDCKKNIRIFLINSILKSIKYLRALIIIFII